MGQVFVAMYTGRSLFQRGENSEWLWSEWKILVMRRKKGGAML